jgi:uroporphyrinogen decarboxylase
MSAKMTPKERAHVVLEHKEPDRIPLLEAWMSDRIIEKVLRRPYAGILDTVDFYRTLEIDFACISFGPPQGWERKFLNEKVFLDEWGRKWQYTREDMKAGVGSGIVLGMYIDGTVKTPEQFDEYEFPSADAPGRMDAFETALELIGNEYAVTGTIDEGIFQRAALMTGLREFLIYLYEKPSFARELLKKHYEFALEVGNCFLDAGAEFILVGDDIADNHGPLLAPKLYEEFVYPYHKALVHSLKKRGAKVIWDTDGNVMPILSYLLDMGIDGLHPIEPTAGMNIVELQRRYMNRLCVVGGVDVVKLLPLGSEDDVEQAIVRLINEVSPGGGLILGSTNSLHTSVPDLDKFVRNVLKYVETAHKFGVYPIKQ